MSCWKNFVPTIYSFLIFSDAFRQGKDFGIRGVLHRSIFEWIWGKVQRRRIQTFSFYQRHLGFKRKRRFPHCKSSHRYSCLKKFNTSNYSRSEVTLLTTSTNYIGWLWPWDEKDRRMYTRIWSWKFVFQTESRSPNPWKWSVERLFHTATDGCNRKNSRESRGNRKKFPASQSKSYCKYVKLSTFKMSKSSSCALKALSGFFPEMAESSIPQCVPRVSNESLYIGIGTEMGGFCIFSGFELCSSSQRTAEKNRREVYYQDFDHCQSESISFY